MPRRNSDKSTGAHDFTSRESPPPNCKRDRTTPVADETRPEKFTTLWYRVGPISRCSGARIEDPSAAGPLHRSDLRQLIARSQIGGPFAYLQASDSRHREISITFRSGT